MLLRPVHRIPSQPDLTQALRGLLGRDVGLSKVVRREFPSFVAVYTDESGAAVNLLCVDLHLAASASAALALVPAGQAEEWVASGSLPDHARENLYEVLNVLAATHNRGEGSRHVKLSSLLSPDDELPAEVASGRNAPALTAWFEVDVAGYPGGLIEAAAF